MDVDPDHEDNIGLCLTSSASLVSLYLEKRWKWNLTSLSGKMEKGRLGGGRALGRLTLGGGGGWLGWGGGGVWVLCTAEFWVFRVHTAMLDFPAK